MSGLEMLPDLRIQSILAADHSPQKANMIVSLCMQAAEGYVQRAEGA